MIFTNKAQNTIYIFYDKLYNVNPKRNHHRISPFVGLYQNKVEFVLALKKLKENFLLEICLKIKK